MFVLTLKTTGMETFYLNEKMTTIHPTVNKKTVFIISYHQVIIELLNMSDTKLLASEIMPDVLAIKRGKVSLARFINDHRVTAATCKKILMT